MPTHITKNTISFVAGFKWGYTEWYELGKRKVTIMPIQELSYSSWNNNLNLLKEKFPNFSYR